MSYRVIGWVGGCIVTLVVLGACDKDGGAAKGPETKPIEVGIVDLDKVASDLGMLQEMKTNLETLELQFKNELQAKQDLYNADLAAELKKYGVKEGDKLTPQQDQALGQMVMVRKNVIGQLQQAAAQQFQAYRADWLKKYREALEPVVRDVAFAKKAKVVVTKTDTVLFVDNSVDLSVAVTEAARAKPPTLAPVPFPKLPAAPDLTAVGTTQPTTKPATGPAAPDAAGKK